MSGELYEEDGVGIHFNYYFYNYTFSNKEEWFIDAWFL